MKFTNPAKIKIEIEDLTGEMHSLVMETAITKDIIDKIGAYSTTNDEKKSSENLIDMFILLFGKDKIFWGNFDMRVLSPCLTWVAKEIKNPTKATQNN